jgi:hypothetical protein
MIGFKQLDFCDHTPTMMIDGYAGMHLMRNWPIRWPPWAMWSGSRGLIHMLFGIAA